MQAAGVEHHDLRLEGRRSTLSYACETMLPHQRKAGQNLSDRITVGGGTEADGHELASERPVSLDDLVVWDVGVVQELGEGQEMVLVPSVERDGDASWLRARVGTLSGGVDYLRDLRPMGEIGADDDVVDERAGTV